MAVSSTADASPGVLGAERVIARFVVASIFHGTLCEGLAFERHFVGAVASNMAAPKPLSHAIPPVDNAEIAKLKAACITPGASREFYEFGRKIGRRVSPAFPVLPPIDYDTYSFTLCTAVSLVLCAKRSVAGQAKQWRSNRFAKALCRRTPHN